jgi:hypothetical protein
MASVCKRENAISSSESTLQAAIFDIILYVDCAFNVCDQYEQYLVLIQLMCFSLL